MKTLLCTLSLVLLLSACQTGTNESVGQKVLADFGLREHSEDYQAPSDAVFSRLDDVGKAEIKRLNLEERHGEVKFQEEGLRGYYFKEVKVYEKFYPVDASATSGTAGRERGFLGLIEFRYRMFQSERKASRAEAAAETAGIPTGIEGSETYRYRFGPTGAWNSGKGELTRQ